MIDIESLAGIMFHEINRNDDRTAIVTMITVIKSLALHPNVEPIENEKILALLEDERSVENIVDAITLEYLVHLLQFIYQHHAWTKSDKIQEQAKSDGLISILIARHWLEISRRISIVT